MDINSIALISAGSVVIAFLALYIIRRALHPARPAVSASRPSGNQENPKLVEVEWKDSDVGGESWEKLMPLSARIALPIASDWPSTPRAVFVPLVPVPTTSTSQHVVEITMSIAMPSPRRDYEPYKKGRENQEFALGMVQVPLQ